MCSTAIVYNNTILKSKNNVVTNTKMTGEEAIDKIFFEHGSGVSACNKLFRKKLFVNVKFPTGRYFEDFWVMHKLFILSKRIIYDNRQLYYYFQRPRSIMYSASIKIASD